jgi:glucokinase
VPVFIENDANAAALGEYVFGAGRGCKDLVYLTVSTGIGGGVIVDGRLMTGASGAAAELGHITIDRKGERCNCGNIGCLESIASGTAIARHASEAIARGEQVLLAAGSGAGALLAADGENCASCMRPHVDAKAVAEAATAGVPAACAIMKDAAEGLGVGLVSIIHIFNPEVIILGGGLTQLKSLLIDPALQIVQERTMKVAYQAVRIEAAGLGLNAGLVGASALVLCESGEGEAQSAEKGLRTGAHLVRDI